MSSIRPEPRPATAARLEAARLGSLPILLVNVHDQCVGRCVMCDIWKRSDGRALPARDLEPHRQALRALGVRQVVLTGGEPMLNPELGSICGFFRSLDIRVTLLASGLLLEQRADCVAAGCDELILSLDGPQAIHDRIRRVPGGFRALERGLRELRARRPGLPIACRTTVQKWNRGHLRATVAAARALGLGRISFLAADLSSAAFNRDQPWSAGRRNAIGLGPVQLAELADEVERLIREHPADLESGFIAESPEKLRGIVTRFREHLQGGTSQAPLCKAPWVSAVMEVDGRVRPCFFHPAIGDARRLPLDEAINTPAALAFRSGLEVAADPTCQRCVCSLNALPRPGGPPCR